MASKVYILLIVTGVISLFHACTGKKEVDCPTTTTIFYNLDDSARSKVAYETGDTLKFTNNIGDTAILLVSGKSSVFQTFTTEIATGCDPNKDNYELMKLGFEKVRPDLNLVFNQSRYTQEIQITFQNSSFNFNYWAVDDWQSVLYPYHVAYTIGSNVYPNVSEITNANSDKLFYNKSSGIIQVINASATWVIIP